MSSFSDWDAELCHYGILGMKWGVRRYQNEDGSWTAAGLKRKAKLERLSFKLETKNEKRRLREESRRNRMRANSEKHKKIKNLTDKELEDRLNRAKKEKELRELTSDSKLKNAVDVGMRAVGKLLEAQERHDQKALQKLENETKQMQAKAQIKQAKYQAKQRKQEAKKAESERRIYETAAKKIEAKTLLKDAKTHYKTEKRRLKDETIHGAIRKRIANIIFKNSGKTIDEVTLEKNNNMLRQKLQNLNLQKKIKELEVENDSPSKREKEAREKRGRSHQR